MLTFDEMDFNLEKRKMNIEDKIKVGLREIILELVNGNYHKLKQLDKMGVLTPEEIHYAIDEYLIENEKLTFPPDEAFQNEVKMIEVVHPRKYKREFGVLMDLWVNDQKSDLTLEADAWEDEKGEVNVSIYDIHVM